MSAPAPTVMGVPSRMKAVNENPTESRRVSPPTAVEVYVDDVEDLAPGWYFGILRQWAHYASCGWTATVQWSMPGPHGDNQRLDRFLTEHIREDTVDRSRGRVT